MVSFGDFVVLHFLFANSNLEMMAHSWDSSSRSFSRAFVLLSCAVFVSFDGVKEGDRVHQISKDTDCTTSILYSHWRHLSSPQQLNWHFARRTGLIYIINFLFSTLICCCPDCVWALSSSPLSTHSDRLIKVFLCDCVDRLFVLSTGDKR